MRKRQKAAVVLAMLGSAGFLGAGVGHASDVPEAEIGNSQAVICTQDNSTQGLIVIDDINLVVAILGLATAENTETNTVSCTSALTFGG